jgi:hypothetical protein
MGDNATAATIELVVKLSPAVVPGSAAHKAFVACAADFGITFEPIFENIASNAELIGYHVALVAPGTTTRAIEQLQQCDGVEAAYTKSRGEPPTGGIQNGN